MEIDPAQIAMALGSKEIIMKVLGPSLEYLGSELKDYAVKRRSTVRRVFENAGKKLGDKLETEDGSVPPKVLRGILNEGSYADDDLAVEYFGGVLASSRTGISRDDRGAHFASLISRLSIYQLRSHYIFYSLWKKLFDGKFDQWDVGSYQGKSDLRLLVPYDVYKVAMDFTGDELVRFNAIARHVHSGLNRENLIANWISGDVTALQKHFKKAGTDGIVIVPSSDGVELFFWAHGLGQQDSNDFLNPELQLHFDSNVKFLPGSQILVEK